MYIGLLAAALLAAAVQGAPNSPPLAIFQAFTVSPNQELVITLKATDADGDPLTINCTTLPTVGTLSQVSPNFQLYGYQPAIGTAISHAPAVVVDTQGRVVFSAPQAMSPTRFTFAAYDGHVWSDPAFVEITLASSGGRVLLNDFNFDAESWTVVASGSSSLANWTGTSTGLLNHYIYYAQASLVVGQANQNRWYFKAPAQYFRDNSMLYGGTLSFVMGSFAGDFSAGSRYATPVTLITLSGAGMTVAQRNVVYSGGIVQFSFELDESGDWLLDPQDSRITNWPAPQQCQFVQILQGLTDIRIYGDLTPNYEAIGIDSFSLTSGTGVPTSCYNCTAGLPACVLI